MSGERVVFVGSDGAYYGEVDIWERFESDRWAPCAWDPESGTEWVETDDQRLLTLTPISRGDLPQSVAVEQTTTGLRIATCE